MLVVSRKENESITIEPADGLDPSMTVREAFAQGAIILTVAHVGPRRVRIAIDAPSVLKIRRNEAGPPGNEAQPEEPAPRRVGSGS